VRQEFRVPDIGEGIAEVEIVEWYVGIGDVIRADQVVASIETDKAVVEMPTPLSGTITELGGNAGDILPVGSVLLIVETNGRAPADSATKPAPSESRAHPAARAEAVPEGQSSPEVTMSIGTLSSRPKASPAVRRLAIEHDIDLNGVQGSGPNGRILAEDILAVSDGGAPISEAASEKRRERPALTRNAGEEDERVPLRGLRRQIARNMVESWRTIPHIIDYREVDASALIELRHALRSAAPEHAEALTYVPVFVKAAATALRRHPLMNASFDEQAGEYILHHRVHVGIATASPDGLLVPVVRDADTKSIVELAVEIAQLVEAARTRKATREQLTGGTYTVNNLGALGASMGTPIIRSPEVGIAGFGRIADRVVAREGTPLVRPIMMLSSVGDHRLLDGDTLGTFTSTLVEMLEVPYRLLAELA
jgi:pyruvate/2-oxoglutarate dehydrogenase complex dihydrolipoamide acyltransferase (E2) component